MGVVPQHGYKPADQACREIDAFGHTLPDRLFLLAAATSVADYPESEHNIISGKISRLRVAYCYKRGCPGKCEGCIVREELDLLERRFNQLKTKGIQGGHPECLKTNNNQVTQA